MSVAAVAATEAEVAVVPGTGPECAEVEGNRDE